MSMGSLQDKQKEIVFFDAHAASAEYDVFAPQANAWLVAAFVRLSRLPRADLGCSGLFTEVLRREGYTSVGLDVSPRPVALHRRKYPGLELIEGDAENLPLDSESLDAIP
jgi:ubiquinone/menaquinone biosynthesis C-methylase UbiE